MGHHGLWRMICSVAVAGVIFAGSLGAAAPARAATDLGDPYQTGCIYNNARIANSGDVYTSTGADYGHIENWYSWGCNTNWVMVFFPQGQGMVTFIDIHTKGNPFSAPAGLHKQCYPTDCSSWYRGGLSPTWTDMIEGTDVACVFVHLSTSPGASFSETNALTTSPPPHGYGSYDALCA